MEELITLTQLISKTKFKSNGVLNLLLERGSQMERLYEAIATQKVQTDEDAQKVFPEFKSDPGRLHTIKSKLKDRLNDSMLLLDFKDSIQKDRQKAFLDCSKKWASAMVLISKNARKNGVTMLEILLKQTQRYEFTELTLDILRTLRLHFGLFDSDPKRFEELGEEINHWENIWVAERKVETCYAELVARYVRTKFDKRAVSERAQEAYNSIKHYLVQYNTFKIHLSGRLCEILIYDSVGDHEQTAACCERALEFFEQKDYSSTTALQAFNYNLFVCYLNLRNHKKCFALAEKSKSIFEEGSYNWFKLNELFFLNFMHEGNYQQAAQTCAMIIDHSAFDRQPPQVIELWKIFEAYVYILAKSNFVNINIERNRFKLGRFLNEVIMFSRDKGGMNISILIIQFLADLLEKNEDGLTDRADNFAKYRSRYLNDDRSTRSNTFFKLLELLPKSGFNRIEAEKRSTKFLAVLQAEPLETSNQNHEIEVLPYTTLWAIAMQILDQYAVKPIYKPASAAKKNTVIRAAI